MTRSLIELDPVTTITIDAIGQPGQRVFYLQASKDEQVYTVLVEKVQIQTLAVGIEQFLEQITEQAPDLPIVNPGFSEDEMRITPPVDPIFRAGEMGLAYDTERDQMCLIAKEILTSGMEEEDASELRLWASRQQLAAVASWVEEISGRGRPLCPQCGLPMEPEGHFCPKKNGHKH